MVIEASALLGALVRPAWLPRRSWRLRTQRERRRRLAKRGQRRGKRQQVALPPVEPQALHHGRDDGFGGQFIACSRALQGSHRSSPLHSRLQRGGRFARVVAQAHQNGIYRLQVRAQRLLPLHRHNCLQAGNQDP